MQHCAQCFFCCFAASINHYLRQFVFFFFLIMTSKEVLGKGSSLKLVTHNSTSTGLTNPYFQSLTTFNNPRGN